MRGDYIFKERAYRNKQNRNKDEIPTPHLTPGKTIFGLNKSERQEVYKHFHEEDS